MALGVVRMAAVKPGPQREDRVENIVIQLRNLGSN